MEPGMKFLKVNKNLIAIIITVGFLIWLIRGIDKDAVIKLINNIAPLQITNGAIFYGFVYLARIARWKALLPKSSNSFKELLAITGIHNLAVRAFPNPTGELVFLQQAKQKNIPYSDSLAALIISRVLDFVLVGFFFIIGVMPFLSNLTKPVFFFLLLSIFFISAGIGSIIFLSSTSRTVPKIVIKVFGFFLLAKFQETIKQKTNQFLNAFGRLRNWKTYLKAVVFSLAIWLSMFLAYFFFLKGFGIELGIRAVLIGGAVQIFANTIPNIGGLGVMEAGWVAGLSVAKIEKSTAIVGALAVDLMTLMGTIIFGLVAFLIQKGEFFASDN
ncbi:MAG: hypothetical protein G01um10142_254 [Parcubacteria group bacterium Gr01-1014_2]|nr:MAG: hypothetical protein G01um10142_254 [Parcubacteria group bacterium Gr01-1014_2]